MHAEREIKRGTVHTLPLTLSYTSRLTLRKLQGMLVTMLQLSLLSHLAALRPHLVRVRRAVSGMFKRARPGELLLPLQVTERVHHCAHVANRTELPCHRVQPIELIFRLHMHTDF